MWMTIQTKASSIPAVQLILDMKVRWSSTYLMLNHAERKKNVRSKFQPKINGIHLFSLVHWRIHRRASLARTRLNKT